jgi:hypothetical protein
MYWESLSIGCQERLVIIDNKQDRGGDRSLAIAMDNIIPVMPNTPKEEYEF